MEYAQFNHEFKSLERCRCGKIYKSDGDDHCRYCNQRRVTDAVQCTKVILHNVAGSRADEGRDFAFGHRRVFMSTKVYHFLKAVVKLRWKHFANVVVARWRFAMCAVKIRDIEESWRRLQYIMKIAMDQNLNGLRRVG